MNPPILLLDLSSLAFRMYFALERTQMKAADGRPSWAVYGFTKALLDLRDAYPGMKLMAGVDSKGATLRAQKYNFYKANRPTEMPEELQMQWPIMLKAIEMLEVPLLKGAGIEADDYVGAVSKRMSDHCYVVSGDKDLFQLVDESVTVLYPNRKSGFDKITPEVVVEKLGVTPEQVVDFKALSGDSSDNIPGVKGVGPKTTVKLLADYQDLDGVYDHIEEIKGSTQTKLIADRDQAYASQWLATIQTDVDLGDNWQPQVPKWSQWSELFSEFGMKSLLTRVGEIVEEQGDVLTQTKVAKKQIKSDLYSVCLEEGSWLCSAEKEGEYYQWQSADLDFVGGSKVLCWAVKDVATKERAEILSHDWLDTQSLAFVYKSHYPLEIQQFWSLCKKDLGFPNDSLASLILYQELYPQLSDGQTVLLETIESPVSEVLGNIQDTGIVFDSDQLKTLQVELTERSESLEGIIKSKLPDGEINIKSSRQLGQALSELGYKLPKTKTGQFSTNKDVLDELLITDDYELIQPILDYRRVTKLNSTYTDALLDKVKDGRLSTTFGQAATGRLSSFNPNLQNIPIKDPEYGAAFRSLFVAEKGYQLIVADYSQIELRFLAHFSQDPGLVEAFESGTDVHSKTASAIFEIPVAEVTSEQRRVGKTLNFALVYQQGVYSTSLQLGISMAQAKQFVAKYFDSFPKVKPYIDQTLENARKTGYVETFFGRRRYFEALNSSNFRMKAGEERAAFNAVLQGSNADLTKKAMVDMHDLFRKEDMKSKILLQVHDEIIVEAPDNEVDRAKELVMQAMLMNQPLNVPIVVDLGVGGDWAGAKG